ncbi:MAG: T9SS type A sorting domain-containing protein [Chloroflexota bacterium]
MKRFLIAAVMAMLCLTSALSAQAGTGGDTVWTRAIGAVEQVRFSPDGQAIYASYLFGSGKPAVALDAQTGELIRQFPGMNAYRIDLSADGQFLAGCELAGGDTSHYRVYEWNALTGELVGKYGQEGAELKYFLINDLSYSPDGKYLGGIYYRDIEHNKKVFGFLIWDRTTRKLIYQKDADPAKRLLFSPDGKYLALCYIHGSTGKNYVELYKTDDWKFYATFDGHTDAIEDMSFSPDGKYLATGGGDGILKIWDVEKKELYWEVQKAHQVTEVSTSDRGNIHCLSFIDKQYLLTGGEGMYISPATLKLWHLPTKQLITTLFSLADRDIDPWDPTRISVGNSFGVNLLDFSQYLSANDKNKIEGAKIRPNPVKNKATLEFTPEKGEFYTIKLYDGSFREINTLLEEFLDNQPQKIFFNTDKLSNGVYYIQISTATSTQTLSFIVER